jgi:tetratricopeptide (TPR) repeat protein
MNAGGLGPIPSPQALQLVQEYRAAILSNDQETAERILGEATDALAANSVDLWALCEAIEAARQVAHAIPPLTSALARHPSSVALLESLSRLHCDLGDVATAGPLAQRAVTLSRESPFAINAFGRCVLEHGAPDKAIGPLRQAVALQPDFAGFHFDLAAAYKRAGLLPAAIDSLEKTIELKVDYIRAYWVLADCLSLAGKHGEGTGIMRRLCALAPSAEAYVGLASMLMNDQRMAESEQYLRRAIETDPNFAPAYDHLGQRMQQLGQFKEAEGYFLKAIELDPGQPNAYLGFFRMKRAAESEMPLIGQMEVLVDQAGRYPEDLRQLRYALGKAYEDLGDYARAMEHFDEANRLSALLVPKERKYQEEGELFLTDQMIKAYNKPFVLADHGVAQEDDRAILIVGMIRSGTTLTEQILSSHPDVAAGGEIFYWTSAKAINLTKGLRVGKVERPELLVAGKSYRKLLDEVSLSARKITDKMPLNYTMLGIIHTIFPRFKVIHCRRHPVDTCLSMYTVPVQGMSCLFNKRNIVSAYKDYLRLMDHWRKVLPQDFFFELDYEALIADREPHIRRMLEFVGLDWNDACLQHEKNEREVNTPSKWQVRQPIYTSSKERWRKYEPWLGEFRELL